MTRAFSISGRVQGVGFRAHTQAKARELALRGCAINLNNGCVYVEAAGSELSMQAFADWLRQGPRFAKVDSVIQAPLAAEESARISALVDFSTG